MRPRTFQFLSTAFSLAIAACKKEPLPERPPPLPQPTSTVTSTPLATTTTTVRLQPTERRPGMRCLGEILPALRPSKAVDYVELRSDFYPQGAHEIVIAGARGEPCSQAKDPATCKKALEGAKGKTGQYLVVTSGDEVDTIGGKATGAFLAPIESAEEAAFTLVQALSENTSAAAALPSCDAKDYKQTTDGWETEEVTTSFCEEKTATTWAVTKAGEIKMVKILHTPPTPNCQPPRRGRRPEGLTLSSRDDGATLGGHLAEAAEMEAASVPAFERLEAELRALRAPVSLRRRANRAAEDEIRHAEVMTRLATRFGRAPRPLSIRAPEPRPIAEMASENAVEGCVFETFAALLAEWQAAHASDAEIRSAMKVIARDETRHAALAWDVDAFLSPLLSSSDRARVIAARQDAFARLETLLADEPTEELRTIAGLPSAREARALLEQLLQVVDHVAAAA